MAESSNGWRSEPWTREHDTHLLFTVLSGKTTWLDNLIMISTTLLPATAPQSGVESALLPAAQNSMPDTGLAAVLSQQCGVGSGWKAIK